MRSGYKGYESDLRYQPGRREPMACDREPESEGPHKKHRRRSDAPIPPHHDRDRLRLGRPHRSEEQRCGYDARYENEDRSDVRRLEDSVEVWGQKAPRSLC